MAVTKAETQLRLAFVKALGQSLGRYLTLPRLRQALETQRSFDLTSSQVWLDFTNDLYARFSETLKDSFARSANSALKALPVRKVSPSLSLGFDATNPLAIQYAQRFAAELVLELTSTSQAALRGIIARMMSGELAVDSAARMIRASIGLLPRQVQALERFRSEMTGKYDTAYIDQQVETYARRQLAHRATVIARTEAARSAVQGQQAAWNQATQQGFLGPGVMKRWITADDELVCELCQPLDGQLAPLDGTWGGYVPPRHVNCRCDAVLAFPENGVVLTRDPRPMPDSVAQSRRSLRPRLKRV